MKKLSFFLLVLAWVATLGLRAEDAPTAEVLLRQSLRQMGIYCPYEAQSVDIYTNGHDKFEALFADIDAARRNVWVEYFIWANDSIGHLALDHLARAAARGCDVRLIIDSYKDRERHYGYDNPDTLAYWRRRGVDMVIFDPFRFPYVNHIMRDHRKIVCIDDTVGYIGGLNVSDYYIVGNPKYGGWRDTHIRVTGPAVTGLMRLFHRQYMASGGMRPMPNERWYAPTIAGVAKGDSVVYFERGRATHQKKAETRRAFVAAFDAVRDTLRLVSPYLLPTPSVRRALIRAIDRGVHVEVMFSLVGDEPMLSYGNFHFARRLVRHGAEVYLYRGKFHHSKIMMLDDQVSMVGSANMNSRSMRWDYEASCFVFSRDVTRRLTAIFEQDKLECDTLTEAYYASRPGSFRRKAWWIDRMLTPFL